MVALSDSGKDALDALVAKVIEEKKIPGFVFGATSADEELYFNGGGYHVVNDPSSGLVNADSVFCICSQTKLITHISALKLLEQGLMDLDTPVADYFSELANPVIVDDEMAEPVSYRPAANVIRIRHLLNSTSGMFYPMKGAAPDKQLDAYAAPHSKENPVSEFISLLKGDLPGIPLKFEPGTDFTYGWGSDILGFIIEKVSGQSLENYFKTNIFDPLGMKTSFYLTPELKQHYVYLTLRRNGQLKLRSGEALVGQDDPKQVRRLLGGAGLYSSMKDYLSLLRHLLQIHAGKAVNPICSPQIVQALFKPTLNPAGAMSLAKMMAAMDPSMPVSGFQWGDATALCTSDWPERRRGGTSFWMGWMGTYHFIDPTTGVAGVFGTQVLPTLEHEELSLYAEFEKTLYASLSNHGLN